ncbi:hypothetical protein N2152v2_008907 [Parachlorella kessleri]
MLQRQNQQQRTITGSSIQQQAQLQQPLLELQGQVNELRLQAAHLRAQALTCSTYTDRLYQLELVFEQYHKLLEQLLQQLGFGVPPATTGSSAAVLQFVQDREEAIQGTLTAGPERLGQLLQECQGSPDCGILTAAAVLPVVQEGLEENLAAAEALPHGSSGVEKARQQQQHSSRDLLDALRERHWQEFCEAEQLRQEQAELVQKLQQAQAPLGEPGKAVWPQHVQLAAQRAGLHAALSLVDRLQQELRAVQRSTAVKQQEAAAAIEVLSQLEKGEADLDRSLGLLCTADSAFMRQWQESTWQTQTFISDSLLAARKPLQQLAGQLAEAMQQELGAFKCTPAPEAAPEGTCASQPAALRLDPTAQLKTAEHGTDLLAAAAEELEALQPVHRAWEELVSHSRLQLQELEGTVARLRKEAEAVDSAGAQGVHEQLDQACGAAEAGMAAVRAVRTAMADWWTLPAFKAAPWVKYDGKSATEWLRVLSEQHDLVQTRAVFEDHSNRKR